MENLENLTYDEIFNAVRDGSLTADEFDYWACTEAAERYSAGFTDGWDAANE